MRRSGLERYLRFGRLEALFWVRWSCLRVHVLNAHRHAYQKESELYSKREKMRASFCCQCLECKEEFFACQGGGVSFISLICDCCGKSASMPRFAPRACREAVHLPNFLQRKTNQLKMGRFSVRLPFSWRLDGEKKRPPLRT